MPQVHFAATFYVLISQERFLGNTRKRHRISAFPINFWLPRITIHKHIRIAANLTEKRSSLTRRLHARIFWQTDAPHFFRQGQTGYRLTHFLNEKVLIPLGGAYVFLQQEHLVVHERLATRTHHRAQPLTETFRVSVMGLNQNNRTNVVTVVQNSGRYWSSVCAAAVVSVFFIFRIIEQRHGSDRNILLFTDKTAITKHKQFLSRGCRISSKLCIFVWRRFKVAYLLLLEPIILLTLVFTSWLLGKSVAGKFQEHVTFLTVYCEKLHVLLFTTWMV